MASACEEEALRIGDTTKVRGRPTTTDYVKNSNHLAGRGGHGHQRDDRCRHLRADGPDRRACGAALSALVYSGCGGLGAVISESLVARTFGTYTLQAFGGDPDSVLVLILGVGLIVFA